ncbi:Retrovirus-related Pol polyprotein from transposon [Nosema granulosis]|uniref:RNA-directed DNA polymerase n=1 Tax=Nosema granulosis TaxID=83296 RepID=A0A9P6KYU4_9MICR|nr:Retrovirus-related Pol polyprotein from transposon [Nosema granulosis]
MEEINSFMISSDMATAAKSINTFSGESNEDVLTWLQEVKFVRGVIGSSEEETRKMMLLKLRGAALSWAAEVLGERSTEISLGELIELLKTRFSSQQTTEISLSKFLTSKHPSTREEFTDLLRCANDLFRKKYMNIIPLTQVVINKAPVEMKALLLQAAETVQSWDQFMKRAEDIAWIAFPDKTLNRVESNARPISPKNYCEWHESDTHNTRDCSFLKQLKEQYKRGSIRIYKRGNFQDYKNKRNSNDSKVIRNIFERDEGCQHCEESGSAGAIEMNSNNKRFSIYTFKNTKTHNPFFINLWVGRTCHVGLIDTGADVSIVPSSLIKEIQNTTKHKTNIRVTSACGNDLKITEKLENMQLRTETGTTINCSPLVVVGGPEYIILGIDVILENPRILTECVNLDATQNLTHKKASKTICNITNLDKILKKADEIFTTEISQMNLCKEGVHIIETGDRGPVYQRTRRIPTHYEREIDNEIKKNLDLGIIRSSSSEWCSRIVPVTKSDGTLRMCIDYRALNQLTTKDRYPLPRIDEILDSLAGAEFFTTLDATSGYYQIAVEEEDKKKTAFAWKGGLYEFNRMPFGLCNAPATFQRTMDKILREERGVYVIPYLDDIVVYSKNLEEHKEHIMNVLNKLKEAGISLNRKKCKFAQTEIKILGTVVSKDKIRPDPDKVKAIREFPMPLTIRELRSFLGIANYCREYIVDYAKMLKPLFDLLKGEKKDSQRKLTLNPEVIEAFKRIKEVIAKGLERNQPDFTKPFILTTDASDYGIGAILSQIKEDGRERMISAFSKNLDKAQLNYSVTDKELLAVVKGIENYRHYLLGAQFVLRTDHKALAYLWEAKNPCSRILRWSLKLQEYAFKVEYIKGSLNIADACSRALSMNVVRKDTLAGLTDNQKSEILKDYHVSSGHGSAKTMKFLLGGRYKWEGMYKDIEDYVKGCRTCSRAGGERVNTKNRMIITESPLDLWELDLIGRIPSKKGNRFIFVAINHFSKWIETRVIPNKSETEIVKCIKDLILQKHGTPKRILTDCGLEFNNKGVQHLAAREDIKWEFASPAHHKTVGCVERVNQTLWNKVKKMCEYGKTSWEKVVPAATWAVNISYNRAIGTSPYAMVFGRLPELSVDEKFGKRTVTVNKDDLLRRRSKIIEKYRSSIMKGKVQILKDFEVGDNVLVYKKHLSNKLLSCWTPGYRVVQKIPPDAYVVKSKGSTLRLNKSHLRLDTVQPRKEVS